MAQKGRSSPKKSETKFETIKEVPIAFSASSMGSVRLASYENEGEGRAGLSTTLRRTQMKGRGEPAEIKSVPTGDDPEVLEAIGNAYLAIAGEVRRVKGMNAAGPASPASEAATG